MPSRRAPLPSQGRALNLIHTNTVLPDSSVLRCPALWQELLGAKYLEIQSDKINPKQFQPPYSPRHLRHWQQLITTLTTNFILVCKCTSAVAFYQAVLFMETTMQRSSYFLTPPDPCTQNCSLFRDRVLLLDQNTLNPAWAKPSCLAVKHCRVQLNLSAWPQHR